MLSEETLERLGELVRDHAGQDRERLEQTLVDIQTALAGQALLIAAQIRTINGLSADRRTLDRLLTQNSMALDRLGLPRRNSFSTADVEAKTKALADQVAAANSATAILTTVVNVAKMFI